MGKEKGYKCAFALCASGERYVSYRDNLVSELKTFIPSADIIDIDVHRAESILPNVSNKRHSIQMTRLAIPLMDEFRVYERVVYVDVDTDIVSGMFSSIIDVDTSMDGLAAVEDIYQEQYKERMKERFPGWSGKAYFNSGLIVMDMNKIDAGKWKEKVDAAIKLHEENPFKLPDQDILNAFFDIKSIDKRFNWIHRRGVDPNGSAWMVHYTDGQGHEMLDEIISMRNISKNGMFVVTSPRHDTLKTWIRSYFANGNTIPLIIVKGNGTWTDEDDRMCRSAARFSGGFVIECPYEFSDIAAIKYVSEKFHPRTWAYVDSKTIVVGNIEECLSYSEMAPGIVLSRFIHPSSIDNRYPERMEDGVMCRPSPVFFHGDASEMIIKDVDLRNDCRVDQALGRLYSNKWHDEFCDFSIRSWDEGERIFNGGVKPESKFVCLTEGESIDLEKISKQPRAPFEQSIDYIDDDDDGSVDAVFVIGTGSVDCNEELRYALRNIEKNCTFIRDVYICGFCPSWVDKSVVKHLNWPDRFSHAKDANIIDKLRHACEHRGIAKRILFCSDDQFQTRKCSWEDFRPRYLRRYASNDRWYEDKHRVWHSRLRKTLEREVKRRMSIGADAGNVFYYQPHIWMQIDRDRFVEYARWCNYETRDDTIIASGYFNFIDADGKPDFDHAFLENNNSKLPSETHVAYHDGSEKAAMRILRSMFPNRCRFELDMEHNENAHMTKKHDNCIMKNYYEKSGYDPSAATHEEISEIHEVSRMAMENPSFGGILGEISRAEELRLFGVRGWRVVWRDIVRRWREATGDGTDAASEFDKRSDDASRVINDYMSNPEGMRTVRFGSRNSSPVGPIMSFGRKTPRPAPEDVMAPLRDRIRSSLRERIKA